MITVRRFGHVGLWVRDLERAVEFYTSVLGLRVSDRMPFVDSATTVEAAFLRCDADHHCLALFELREEGEAPTGLYPGLHHFAFEVASFEQLRDVYRLLKSRDAPRRAWRRTPTLPGRTCACTFTIRRATGSSCIGTSTRSVGTARAGPLRRSSSST